MYNGADRNYKMTDGDMGLTWEKNFKSRRPDGRHTSTLAALMAMMRDRKGDLNLPEQLDKQTFADWQRRVKERARELLALPELPEQPAPVLLSSTQREGYRVEKWEFYPDRYRAIPYLVMIPDGASAAHPVPGVLCFLGSNHPKEFAAGEPSLRPGHPNFDDSAFHYPERNRMGRYLAQSGMAAFLFDNPGVGETSVMTDPAAGMSDMYTRQVMCNGLLDFGLPYVGLCVFQHLQFLRLLKTFDYVDQGRIGVSSHSLGSEPAIFLGLLCDEIRAIVFNEDLHDDRRRFMCITEVPGRRMFQNYGNWHIVPGQFAAFGYQDMCAAFAPRYLGMTEGGADEFMHTITRAYEFCGAMDHLVLNYYTDYLDPARRAMDTRVPDFGLSSSDFYQKYMYVTVSDHSYRGGPALTLLRRAFGLEEEH